MISKALHFISDFLNKEIKLNFGIEQNNVMASSLINPDGSVTANIENKIIISVINLEHETAIQSRIQHQKGPNGVGLVNPAIHLNLYLLVSANYDSGNYLEALKMLSAVIGVFQANTLFTRENFPAMEPPLERLTFEIFNLPINELSHIWSGIGAKYVPSIVYKVRMISISEGQINKEVTEISGLNPSSNPNKTP